MSLSLIYTLLPVPVGPTNITGLLCLIRISMRNLYRAVSMVGTMISLIFVPLPPRLLDLIVLVQCVQFPRPLAYTGVNISGNVYHACIKKKIVEIIDAR